MEPGVTGRISFTLLIPELPSGFAVMPEMSLKLVLSPELK